MQIIRAKGMVAEVKQLAAELLSWPELRPSGSGQRCRRSTGPVVADVAAMVSMAAYVHAQLGSLPQHSQQQQVFCQRSTRGRLCAAG